MRSLVRWLIRVCLHRRWFARVPFCFHRSLRRRCLRFGPAVHWICQRKKRGKKHNDDYLIAAVAPTKTRESQHFMVSNL